MCSNCVKCIFIILLIFDSTVNAQSCVTPFGENGDCVSLYDCQLLLAAFEERPIPASTISFLRRSQCGFDGNIPRVCCGQRGPPKDPPRPQWNQPTEPPRVISSNIDPVYPEDSQPSPKHECGDDSSDRVLGGQITALDEFPWMALLGYRKKDGSLTYQCGGVLINRRYVLTAAHCVTGEVERSVGKLTSVRLGEYNVDTSVDCVEFLNNKTVCADPHQEIQVDRTIPHSGYSDQYTNRRDDIALIRLAQRANYTTFIQPICLADGSTRTQIHDELSVAGWGKTLSGSNSNVKLKLTVPVYDKQRCISKYNTLNAILTDKQICAGGVFKEDTCRGDSGGPLMRSRSDALWETVGIVSFGRGCGGDDWPGVYTYVPSYTNWILETLRSSNQ